MRQFENLKMIAFCLMAALLLCGCKKETETPVANQSESIKPENNKKPDDAEACDADFDSFFKKFSADSVYQFKHIKFPLKDSYLSDDYSKTITKYIDLKDCKYYDFSKDKDNYKKDTDAYSVAVLQKQDSVYYKWRGVDNGIYIDFKFAFTDGCWQMVEIDDHST